MTVILDAMGSDLHPDPEIQAAVTLASEDRQSLILVGNEPDLLPRLKALNADLSLIRIVHAPEVLEMGDKPVENARHKAQNSMAVGIDLVKSGDGQAFVTAGNTGGAMVTGLLRLGRIKGIQRPALTAPFPVMNGKCVVVDIGANADCRPDFLLQFGIMGSLYAQKVWGVENPRVGLLSNGEEPGKGNQLIKDTYPLLAGSKLNFIGNIESKELFAGHADVVVTDGFTGNVLLKTSEAVSKFMVTLLRQELTSTTRTKVGALLAKPAFDRLKRLMDPSEVGAAPLLGLDGLVFIGHGRSDARALVSAVRVARQAIDVDLLGSIRTALQEQMAELS